jgi:hypothetical protein
MSRRPVDAEDPRRAGRVEGRVDEERREQRQQRQHDGDDDGRRADAETEG